MNWNELQTCVKSNNAHTHKWTHYKHIINQMMHIHTQIHTLQTQDKLNDAYIHKLTNHKNKNHIGDECNFSLHLFLCLKNL